MTKAREPAPDPGTAWPPSAKIPRQTVERSQRHLFLCTGPDCCNPVMHEPLWQLLKAECQRLQTPVLRTRAACLRVCCDGPWLVVYPEGIWYGRLDPRKLRRILKEHIEGGHPVREWIAAQSGR